MTENELYFVYYFMDVFTSTVLYIALFCGLYYQVFLLITFFERSEKTSALKISGEQPSVTIIVPCFNEAKTVEKTVRSLLALDYPADKLFIHIIDDGSTDETFSVANNLAKTLATENIVQTIKVTRKENGGKYTALNLGISQATTEFVGCLDADSIVHPAALSKMIPYFFQKNNQKNKSEKVAAVTPAMHVHEPKNILQKMQSIEYNFGVFAKQMFGRMDAIHVTPGPFSIFRREIFSKIGPFRHAHNTEDMEIAFRIQTNGYRIANCPSAHVYTITPNTLKKLHRQRTRWVYGFIQNCIDYRYVYFKKKYGNLAVFTLPFSTIAIITGLTLALTVVYQFARRIFLDIDRIRTIGLHFNSPTLNWFYINTQSIMFLSLVVLTLTIGCVLIGKKMAGRSPRLSFDLVYFIVGYSFIAPFWVGKAVWNTLLFRKTPWR